MHKEEGRIQIITINNFSIFNKPELISSLMNDKIYTIEEHIHRFGLWAAARAANKSLLSNKEVQHVLGVIQIREKVASLKKVNNLNDNQYTIWLKENCTLLINEIKKLNCKELKKVRISYGLAAKLISIYIKVVEVIPNKGNSQLSQIAFPPVDSILLKHINKSKKIFIETTWSKYNWEEYLDVVQKLKSTNNNQPMWMIESNWSI
jgi:hypothetical protein